MEVFEDFHSPPVGIDSTWRNKKTSVSEHTETDPILFKEVGSQSRESTSVQTQTEDTVNHEPELNPYPPSLYAFLAKVIDPMCEALQENLSPFSICLSDDFYGNTDADDKNVDIEAKQLHELRNPTVPENFAGSCVAWSPSGNQIAVGYRSKEHDTWCTDSTPISIWNLTRLPFEVDHKLTAPHTEILVRSCTCALEFHPKTENLLAVGLYNGEVMLVDLNKNKGSLVGGINISGAGTDNQNSRIPDTSSCHTNSVVGVHWVLLSHSQTKQLIQKNPTPSQWFILSAATDGLIGLWSVNTVFTKIFLERKYVAYSDYFPENVNISKRVLSRVKEVGVTAMSTCKDDPAIFVFSTYGGMIFQGDLLTGNEISDLELQTRNSPRETAPIINGITSYVTEQTDYINALHCSPFHRNLILFCTMSGHVLLQNLLQSNPILQFYMDENSAADIQWSSRPMMFGVAEGKNLSIIDLLVSKTKPILVIKHKNKLRTIAFEKTDTGFVATTDDKGVLHIWKLPKSLTTHQFTEMDALMELGQFSVNVEPNIQPSVSKII